MPQSINAGGDVTGYYHESNNRLYGFVRRDELGKLISFDPPGSIQTMALSINAKSDITGFYNEANNVVHGFVRRPGGPCAHLGSPVARPGQNPLQKSKRKEVAGCQRALKKGCRPDGLLQIGSTRRQRRWRRSLALGGAESAISGKSRQARSSREGVQPCL
jgi:hypothetical protein